MLNSADRHGATGATRRENTIVIASSVSNGGYAALAAAEQDTRGLIDGLALSEPNVSLAGVRSPRLHSRCSMSTCPAHRSPTPTAPRRFNTVPQPLREARCASLAKKGLLRASTLAQQAAESQRILNEYGILPDANLVLPSHYTLSVLAEHRGHLREQLRAASPSPTTCAATATPPPRPPATNAAQPVAAAGLEHSFAPSNGIPPTAGINLVNNLSPGGAKEDRLSVSPSTGARD